MYKVSAMDNMSILFTCPRVEKAGNRRRPRTAASCDEGITCRRDRLEKRNRALIARYYYWTELKRRRFDDVLKILADNEFFIEERTVSTIVVEQDEFYNDLLHSKASSRKLKTMFPGFDWN